MSKITKETAKNILLTGVGVLMSVKVKSILLGVVRLFVRVLFATVLTLLIMGAVSWYIGWRTWVQYAEMLFYAGIGISVMGFFTGKEDHVPVQSHIPEPSGISKYDLAIEFRMDDAKNRKTDYSLKRQFLFVPFTIVGLLMIACSAFVHTYLVN